MSDAEFNERAVLVFIPQHPIELPSEQLNQLRAEARPCSSRAEDFADAIVGHLHQNKPPSSRVRLTLMVPLSQKQAD